MYTRARTIEVNAPGVRFCAISLATIVAWFILACAKPAPEPKILETGDTVEPRLDEDNEIQVIEADQDAPVESPRRVGVRISTYYLSAGDDIRIGVYGYSELERTIRIPPDGHIYYPRLGEIYVDGMSIPELRGRIADGLSSPEERTISVGDTIAVRVYRNEDLDTQTIVPSSGRLYLPLAGEVEVVGLTVEEANLAIAEKLSRFLVSPAVSTSIQESALPGRITDPHVIVEVLRFGGHKVLVLGEVAQPGVYLNDGGTRVLELVARAGGPTTDAKLDSVALIRPATEISPAQAAVVNVSHALQSGELGQNPVVLRGDIIYVPRTTFASVARFFDYVYRIVRPIVVVETGIWLGQNVEAGPRQNLSNTILFQ